MDVQAALTGHHRKLSGSSHDALLKSAAAVRATYRRSA
ncbi:unnamed protein product [Ciceribacter selenitireducens ATCC BAA-1503]|uniref:Uncharacterized protein n=1 Tax=Ciceribacter selenitireducens ATCC BAA-1503 TaxID=1336235 RepID=A0A376AIU4_9HYPH|nr:unnamed protein product [Ciceribacter selenitireducens ATCC BAA-1503]